MSKSMYSHEQIIQAGQFSPEDIKEIVQRRRNHNRLGFAYQLAFVCLTNLFPAQQPFEAAAPTAVTCCRVTLDGQAGTHSRYTGVEY